MSAARPSRGTDINGVARPSIPRWQQRGRCPWHSAWGRLRGRADAVNLILEVASTQPTTGASRHTFHEDGGSIGRETDNTWVLPHSKVSGLHAVITFRNAVFYIEDTQQKRGVHQLIKKPPGARAAVCDQVRRSAPDRSVRDPVRRSRRTREIGRSRPAAAHRVDRRPPLVTTPPILSMPTIRSRRRRSRHRGSRRRARRARVRNSIRWSCWIWSRSARRRSATRPRLGISMAPRCSKGTTARPTSCPRRRSDRRPTRRRFRKTTTRLRRTMLFSPQASASTAARAAAGAATLVGAGRVATAAVAPPPPTDRAATAPGRTIDAGRTPPPRYEPAVDSISSRIRCRGGFRRRVGRRGARSGERHA